MRSPKIDRKVIEVLKERDLGPLPPYISLAHRHLEKEAPFGVMVTISDKKSGEIVEERGTYNIPTDLLRMMMPEKFVNEIESLEFEYRKRT